MKKMYERSKLILQQVPARQGDGFSLRFFQETKGRGEETNGRGTYSQTYSTFELLNES